ncbi:uncharacterized protein [Cardiocondyla obscurior]|uniref:uncharacterized protein n=1 Tax=Cardiocondyla obscurior TaxID=286306 RepID=UPI0039658500
MNWKNRLYRVEEDAHDDDGDDNEDHNDEDYNDHVEVLNGRLAETTLFAKTQKKLLTKPKDGRGGARSSEIFANLTHNLVSLGFHFLPPFLPPLKMRFEFCCRYRTTVAAVDTTAVPSPRLPRRAYRERRRSYLENRRGIENRP